MVNHTIKLALEFKCHLLHLDHRKTVINVDFRKNCLMYFSNLFLYCLYFLSPKVLFLSSAQVLVTLFMPGPDLSSEHPARSIFLYPGHTGAGSRQ